MPPNTQPTSEPAGWRSWHLHLSNLDPTAADEVLRRVVGPAVDQLRLGAPQPAWFFLRYWQEGPHLRLRVARLDDASAQALEDHLRRSMADVAASTPAMLTAEEYRRYAAPLAAAGEGGRALEVGELRLPGVYRRLYQPELDRYGGARLMAVSEALFQVASELSMAFLRRRPPETARSGLGFLATRAALGVLADADRRRSFCRRAGAGWQAWAARAGGLAGPGNDPPLLPTAPPEGAVPAPLRRWVEQLAPAMDRWRQEAGEVRAQRILHSHIHLLHNRLGLGVGHEYNHYRALAASPALAVTP